MPSQKNIQVLQEVKDKVNKAEAMFFVDYQGLTHQQLEEARKELRKNDSEAAVVKNTLMNIALQEKGVDAKEKLSGAHATLFAYSDAVKTAKVLAAFYKKYQLPKVKFGVFNGEIIDEMTINQLATIPPREELIAKIVGGMKSPLYGLHRALSFTLTQFVMTLKEVEKKKATETPTPVPSPEPVKADAEPASNVVEAASVEETQTAPAQEEAASSEVKVEEVAPADAATETSEPATEETKENSETKEENTSN